MSNLAAGIPIGLSIGIGAGIGSGIGIGKSAGKKEVADAIRNYAATHTIHITGSNGTSVPLEEFIGDVTAVKCAAAPTDSKNHTILLVILGLLLIGVFAGLVFFVL